MNRRTRGDKHSTFAIKAASSQELDSAGEIFAFQHDPEAVGDNEYTVFDESDGQMSLFSPSRAGKLLFNAKLPDGVGTYRPGHGVRA